MNAKPSEERGFVCRPTREVLCARAANAPQAFSPCGGFSTTPKNEDLPIGKWKCRGVGLPRGGEDRACPPAFVFAVIPAYAGIQEFAFSSFVFSVMPTPSEKRKRMEVRNISSLLRLDSGMRRNDEPTSPPVADTQVCGAVPRRDRHYKKPNPPPSSIKIDAVWTSPRACLHHSRFRNPSRSENLYL